MKVIRINVFILQLLNLKGHAIYPKSNKIFTVPQDTVMIVKRIKIKFLLSYLKNELSL